MIIRRRNESRSNVPMTEERTGKQETSVQRRKRRKKRKKRRKRRKEESERKKEMMTTLWIQSARITQQSVTDSMHIQAIRQADLMWKLSTTMIQILSGLIS